MASIITHRKFVLPPRDKTFHGSSLHLIIAFLLSCREGKKKQNVKCVRFDVNGECRALLIASRDIPKGERLYYDYNGYEHEYPTEHFV